MRRVTGIKPWPQTYFNWEIIGTRIITRIGRMVHWNCSWIVPASDNFFPTDLLHFPFTIIAGGPSDRNFLLCRPTQTASCYFSGNVPFNWSKGNQLFFQPISLRKIFLVLTKHRFKENGNNWSWRIRFWKMWYNFVKIAEEKYFHGNISSREMPLVLTFFFWNSFFWENCLWKIEKRVFWQMYVYIYYLLP
jgi:hypothetical protein